MDFESTSISHLLIEELRSLGVGSLRKLCSKAGINSASFCDKQDFVDALLPLSAAFQAVAAGKFESNLSALESAYSIVFLDVDGVLNTKQRSSAYGGENSGAEPTASIDPACVARLVHLCTASTPFLPSRRLVLASTWRGSLHLKASLWSMLVGAGLPHDCFVGQTPYIAFKDRALEIEQWLVQLQEGDTSGHWSGGYVVIDDMDLDTPKLQGHFVWVDPEFALSDENISSAFECLAMVGRRGGS
jgi:hypothetical protein